MRVTETESHLCGRHTECHRECHTERHRIRVIEMECHGRLRAESQAVIHFIDMPTVQNARLSAPALSAEIATQFNIPLFADSLSFHYQPPRYIKSLSLQTRLIWGELLTKNAQ
jgi:hypothetical protein